MNQELINFSFCHRRLSPPRSLNLLEEPSSFMSPLSARMEFPPSCLLHLPEARTELLNSKLMSTLIEAVIGLIALINHLCGGTTFVGIWNRR